MPKSPNANRNLNVVPGANAPVNNGGKGPRRGQQASGTVTSTTTSTTPKKAQRRPASAQPRRTQNKWSMPSMGSMLEAVLNFNTQSLAQPLLCFVNTIRRYP